MIPKKIHYCWFGRNPLPELAERCIASWKKYCPDYEIFEWNEDNFNLDCYPYVREAYDAGKWAFVSDVARLYALVTYGGIYMDTDVEVLKPLDDILKYEAVSGFEAETRIQTGIMACQAGQKLFKEFLFDYKHQHFTRPNGSYDMTTNVTRITDACLKYGLKLNNTKQTIHGFTLFPTDFFCPKDCRTMETNITQNTYVIHHFDGSWNSDKKLNRFVKKSLPPYALKVIVKIIDILKWGLGMIKIGEIKDFIVIFTFRLLLCILYIFPINYKKVFFSSYEGKQFSCNPKYIFLQLNKLKKTELTYVYEYNGNNLPVELQKKAKTVTHNSFRYILEIMTSRVIITNSGLTPKIPIRRSQILINTWHGGGAYKKVGRDLKREMNGFGNVYWVLSAKQTTFFLSSSRKFSEVIHSSHGIPYSKMIKSGMPRNDLFFKREYQLGLNRDKFKQGLGINNTTRLVLYAPTYRGKVGDIEKTPYKLLDVRLLLKTLTQKFGGEWELLYRGHYFNDILLQKNFGIDVSSYPDMQELLLMADVLITDYSSSIWDFSFTNKPAFLFTPDIESYVESRDFYTSIDEWPYKRACDNQELCTAISNYDFAEQLQNNKKHHKNLESYEIGKATEEIVNLILRYL